MFKRIVLVGFSASGKSSVGKIVADKLGIDFFDTDSMIEQSQGLTIAHIFRQFGQQHFRKLEADIVMQLPTSNCVVACGGGTLTEKTAHIVKANSIVVWLKVSQVVAQQRLSRQKGRPLLENISQANFEHLFAERQQIYQKHANMVVECNSLSISEIAQSIVEKLNNLY